MLLVQLFLVCLMLVGWITAKTRIVDVNARATMTNLILFVFLPCNILHSFFSSDRSKLPALAIMLAVAVGVMALSFVLSLLLYRRAGAEQRKVLLYATIVSNATFLGNPVVESIFGTEALPYAAVYVLPMRIAVWTAGLAIFTGSAGNMKKAVLHPCLIATYIGLAMMVAGFRAPLLLERLLFSLGGCTIPMSMLVIGAILAAVDPRKVVSHLTVYYTFIRLLLLPLVVMGVLLALRPAPMVSGIAIIMSAMPAGATTPILADKYGGDSTLASGIVFVSTLLSIVTAPLFAVLVQRVF
ncbi:MAG: AEC family transporter, partial [Treponema sp.]|nr:AEC family transporter [Treponema sp.]